MQCKCGGTMSESTHEVKTLKKAIEWCKDAKESDLPLTINQNKCGGCGRLHFQVANNEYSIIRVFN